MRLDGAIVSLRLPFLLEVNGFQSSGEFFLESDKDNYFTRFRIVDVSPLNVEKVSKSHLRLRKVVYSLSGCVVFTCWLIFKYYEIPFEMPDVVMLGLAVLLICIPFSNRIKVSQGDFSIVIEESSGNPIPDQVSNKTGSSSIGSDGNDV